MFIYLHKALPFSPCTFIKLFATKAAMTFCLKENLTTLNKSEQLYFSDDNEHITGEQAHSLSHHLAVTVSGIHAQYALSGMGGCIESVG